MSKEEINNSLISNLLNADLSQEDFIWLYQGLLRKDNEKFYKALFANESGVSHPKTLDRMWKHWEHEQYQHLLDDELQMNLAHITHSFHTMTYQGFVDTVNQMLYHQKITGADLKFKCIDENKYLYIIDEEQYTTKENLSYLETTVDRVLNGSLDKSVLPSNVWVGEEALKFIFTEAMALSNCDEVLSLRAEGFINQHFPHLDFPFRDVYQEDMDAHVELEQVRKNEKEQTKQTQEILPENPKQLPVPEQKKLELESIDPEQAPDIHIPNELNLSQSQEIEDIIEKKTKLEIGDILSNISGKDITLISNKNLGGILFGGIKSKQVVQINDYNKDDDNYWVTTLDGFTSVVIDRKTLEDELTKNENLIAYTQKEYYEKNNLEMETNIGGFEDEIDWNDTSHEKIFKEYQTIFKNTVHEIKSIELTTRFSKELKSLRYLITLDGGLHGHFPINNTEKLALCLENKILPKKEIIDEEFVKFETSELKYEKNGKPNLVLKTENKLITEEIVKKQVDSSRPPLKM